VVTSGRAAFSSMKVSPDADFSCINASESAGHQLLFVLLRHLRLIARNRVTGAEFVGLHVNHITALGLNVLRLTKTDQVARTGGLRRCFK
jgi:hypothetical protein